MSLLLYWLVYKICCAKQFLRNVTSKDLIATQKKIVLPNKKAQAVYLVENLKFNLEILKLLSFP